MLSLLISTALASLYPGQSTTLTFALSGGTAADLQWDYSYAGLTIGTPAIGAAATAAGKTLGVTTGGGILIYGLDAQVMSPGNVASVTVSVPLGAAAGTAVISLSNVIAGDANGGSIPIDAGFPITLIILPAPVASVVAPAAVANSAMVAPTLQVGANIQAFAATAAASAVPPRVSGGSGSLGPQANVFAVPATAAAAMLAPSLSLGANIQAVAAQALAQMLVPATAPAQHSMGHGPSIFHGHSGRGHARAFR